MKALSAPILATGSLSQSHGTNRAKLAAAAKQFEAIFVRQMLAAARKTDFGGGALSGQGLDTFRTMQDEHFADLAAERGAFGLAKLIERQLAVRFGTKTSAAPPTSSAHVGPSSFTAPAQPPLGQDGALNIPKGGK